MLQFTDADVRRLLPTPACIRRMGEAFDALAAGKAQNQPRRRLFLPSGAVLHQMAASWNGYFGTKIYATHPYNDANFTFLLYEADTAKMLARFDANYLGQIRTGAVSGLATDRLARREARVLAIIGSGFQARAQAVAVAAVRQLDEVRVWSRSQANCEAFARDLKDVLPVCIAASAEQAVTGAHIVCTATNAREPVLELAWIGRGTHINAIGANHARRRELPADLLHRADYVAVDSIDQARLEAGDLLLNLKDEEWAGIDELQNGRTRQNEAEVTIFKSLGIAVEDVAAAALVYEAAMPHR